jgi:glycosyltransferase involved in cell wall biosynthesis
MVNLEAMGLAKPVVATNIGGPVEVFEDGVSGILIEPGIPDRLAEAVSSLLDDPAFARRMGEAARRRREAQFRLEDTVQKTQAVYQLVFGMSRATASSSVPPQSLTVEG